MTTHRSMEPHEEDAAVQDAILHHVLDEHPSLLSQADLIREIPSGRNARATRDNVERAIDELVKRGLLDRLGDYALPTRAAVYSRELGGP
jgi:hypothetical protein